MMAMELGKAAKHLSGAVDELLRRTGRASVGVVGFCMGGGLALVLACRRPDAVGAVVPAYGVVPWADVQPDYSAMTAAVLGHAAEHDNFFTPDAARALEAELTALGKDVTFHHYAGVDHAFFNEDRPEVYDAAAAQLLWDRTVAFLHERLDSASGRDADRGRTELVEDYLDPRSPPGRHIDGMVDAYYGPPELAEAVDAEPIAPPGQLLAESRALLAALDAGEPLDGPGFGPGSSAEIAPDAALESRRHCLRPSSALTTCAKLAGEPIGYADEVEACYGVRPRRFELEELEAAHRRLDDVVPGDGPAPRSLRGLA